MYFTVTRAHPGIMSHDRRSYMSSLKALRESSFNMTRGGGGDEDIETRSLKF